MYDLNSNKELNEDFRISYHDDNIKNNDEDQISKAKGRPIKNNKNNKQSFLTVK